LEDRTLLSGNVIALLNPVFASQLLIQGDNANNVYSLHLATFLNQPSLAVTGALGTAINSIPGGTVYFPLGNISQINIIEGNGTNTINIGNGGPISIPGSIIINVGSGADTVNFSNVSANAGIISFTANGGSTDNISMTNVVAGKVVITTGTGNATVSQSNVTLGFDTITTNGTNAANGAIADVVTVTNSMFHPPPRPYAIGQLAITTNNGNDTIDVDRIDVGLASVTAGTGKNSLIFDDSLIQSVSIQNGSAQGAGTSSLNFSNNTIVGTGNAVTINLLNPSGINGGGGSFPFFFGGGSGSIYNVTMDNDQFTNSGNLSLTVDDGVPYVANVNGTPTLQAASTVEMHLVDTGGHIGINLGNHFQSVLLGQGTVGVNDLDAGSMDVSIGNDNDIIIVSANVVGDGGNENISIGDVTTAALGGVAAPTPHVFINGIWNNDGDEAVNILLGNNNNPNLGTGWPININENAGSLSIGPLVTQTFFFPFPFFGNSAGPNGLAVNISSTTVAGLLSVTMGNGGPGITESLTLNNVTAGDINISFNSNAADAPDGNTTAGVNVFLQNVVVTDLFGGLTMTDTGAGADIVTMLGVNVAGNLMIALSSTGLNTLTAQNVTAAFGMVNVGANGLYDDAGGNFGYFVTGFPGSLPGVPSQPPS
jgi:hypothetical protein